MTKAIWIIFTLFALGNAFFILPFHIGSEKITTQKTVSYKKDTFLLKAVFPDSSICLKFNMEPRYLGLLKIDTTPCFSGNPIPLLLNITIQHDVGYLSVLFPFYKSDNFNAEITYNSILKIEDQPDRDSLAINGHVLVKGNITLAGIFTPMHARKLVENELAGIAKKEMDKLKRDVNKPEVVENTTHSDEPVKPAILTSEK